jgi:hypothetical protein
MVDFSRLNHLSIEIKQLIVTGQSLIDQSNATLKDRYCNFDLTSKRQLKGDCRKVEKCIQTMVDGKVTDKTVKQLSDAVTCLQTSYTGLVAFFTR